MKGLSEDVLDLLEQLAPVQLPKASLPKTRASEKGLRRDVVVGDFHFPLADERVVSILLQVIRDWGPNGITLNGDLPDMLQLGKYIKDFRTRWPLSRERAEMQRFLLQLHEAAPANARIVETNANHSGNSSESRWWRFLSERLGELSDLPEVGAALDYRKIWHPQEPWNRVEVVDSNTITKGLVALHGTIVRSKAAYSAMAMLEKYRANLIHGHTHRMGSTGYRVPAVGQQRAHQMRALEGGCACRLEAPYGDAHNWQQGFVLVLSSPDGHWSAEQVLVQEGRAIVTTLGKEYRAE